MADEVVRPTAQRVGAADGARLRPRAASDVALTRLDAGEASASSTAREAGMTHAQRPSADSAVRA